MSGPRGLRFEGRLRLRGRGLRLHVVMRPGRATVHLVGWPWRLFALRRSGREWLKPLLRGPLARWLPSQVDIRVLGLRVAAFRLDR